MVPDARHSVLGVASEKRLIDSQKRSVDFQKVFVDSLLKIKSILFGRRMSNRTLKVRLLVLSVVQKTICMCSYLVLEISCISQTLGSGTYKYVKQHQSNEESVNK